MLRFFILFSIIFLPHFANAKVAPRTVTLEWSEVKGSQGFELEFRRVLKQGRLKSPIFFKSKSTTWSGAIQPGRYQFRIRSKDDREVWGEWSAATEYWVRLPAPLLNSPEDNVVIKSKNSEKEKVQFQWSDVEGSSGYWIDVVSSSGVTVVGMKTDSKSIELELGVADTYRWSVSTLMEDDVNRTDALSDLRTLTLRGASLNQPELNRPDSIFVEELSWAPTPFASTYDLIVERQIENQKWKTLKKYVGLEGLNQKIDPKFPGGRWRARMIAKSPLRETSSQGQLEFDVYDGLRTPSAIEEAKTRAAIEQSRDHYMIASYLVTSLDYNGQFADLPGLSTQLNAVSGTGRLGYSHFARRSQWGLVAIADLGGVIINNQNHTFASLELTTIWRTYYRGITQLRLFGGLSYRERPRAKGLSAQDVSVVNISTADLTFGGQIWQPLSAKFGGQLNGQILYNAIGLSLPDEGRLAPQVSYQAGLLASYKYQENITCLAGYAYRKEQLYYQNSFGTNRISTTGHYLNLYLEWGFK